MVFAHVRDVADGVVLSIQHHLAKGGSKMNCHLLRVFEPMVQRVDEAAGALRGRVQVSERRRPNRVSREIDALLL